jgi:iron-sulfur cluster repair protein YtfE (RIC family)
MPTPADDLDVMAKALEVHRLKEAMRLVPMMDQGGSTSIAHLVDHMRDEHRAHADAVAARERRMTNLR